MVDDLNYDKLDALTLTTLLINPDNGPDVHRKALSALSRINPSQRRSRLIVVMRNLIRMPERYDQDMMQAVIDLLATDPEPDATQAMLELLPEILILAVTDRDALKPEFREYFYQALVTRQREEDLEVWAEVLPQLDAKTLVAALLDPAAGALDAIEPVTLIDRLPEPERTKALFSVVAGLIQLDQRPEALQEAVKKLRRSSDPTQFESGLESLIQRWEKATRSNQQRLAAVLLKVLGALDTRPRTAAERLVGKRPWAS